jgi:hypothetical protein
MCPRFDVCTGANEWRRCGPAPARCADPPTGPPSQRSARDLTEGSTATPARHYEFMMHDCPWPLTLFPLPLLVCLSISLFTPLLPHLRALVAPAPTQPSPGNPWAATRLASSPAPIEATHIRPPRLDTFCLNRSVPLKLTKGSVGRAGKGGFDKRHRGRGPERGATRSGNALKPGSRDMGDSRAAGAVPVRHQSYGAA